MNDPLGWPVWRRGALLGLRFLAVFFGATLLAYFLLGALGWSGIAQALCAMGVGPVAALGIIVAWLLIRHPMPLGSEMRGERGGKSEGGHE
jgi:hypothetical protein